jgi:ribosomal 50S subunit-recycling heat shock protein
MSTSNPPGLSKLRIDKWLWAARFFKTRSLAKAAIEGGKVQLDGQRIKVSREISVGDQLRIRQGWDERDVIVEALSTSAAARRKRSSCTGKPRPASPGASSPRRRASSPAA